MTPFSFSEYYLSHQDFCCGFPCFALFCQEHKAFLGSKTLACLVDTRPSWNGSGGEVVWGGRRQAAAGSGVCTPPPPQVSRFKLGVRCYKTCSGHKPTPCLISLAPRPQTPLAEPAQACPGFPKRTPAGVEGGGQAGRAACRPAGCWPSNFGDGAGPTPAPHTWSLPPEKPRSYYN